MSAIIEKRNLAVELESAFLKRGYATDTNRTNAFNAFTAMGLPGNKSEEYKFTPVTRALEKIFEGNAGGETNAPSPYLLIPDLKCNVLAFVNGSFSIEHSVLLDEDVSFQLTSQDISENGADPFDLLNQAFHPELLVISVASKKSIQHPVAIVHSFDSPQFVFANPRWKFKLGAQSSASIIEYTVSQGSIYFNNKHSHIEVGENASLEFTTVQNGPATDIQVNNSLVHIYSSAMVDCFTITLDGQLVRNNLSLIVDGQGVGAHLHGLYLISKNTVADNHTVVDHRKPNSYSNELYKGVMNGNARGVFNGKIYVRPNAQKTNAFQSNRNILLSESATINTKPQLEIWADDVKCSHGCTTGQMDEEALFYLRSRGISKEMSRSMLLNAFAAETIAPMKNEMLRSFLSGLITEKLNKNF